MKQIPKELVRYYKILDAIDKYPEKTFEIYTHDFAKPSVFLKLAKTWRLEDSDAANLIDVSEDDWEQIKQDKWTREFSEEQQVRVLTCLDIYSFGVSFFGKKSGSNWIHRPNTGRQFKGRRPLELMLEGMKGIKKTWGYTNEIESIGGEGIKEVLFNYWDRKRKEKDS